MCYWFHAISQMSQICLLSSALWRGPCPPPPLWSRNWVKVILLPTITYDIFTLLGNYFFSPADRTTESTCTGSIGLSSTLITRGRCFWKVIRKGQTRQVPLTIRNRYRFPAVTRNSAMGVLLGPYKSYKDL